MANIPVNQDFIPVDWASFPGDRDFAIQLAWSVALARRQKLESVEFASVVRLHTQTGWSNRTEMVNFILDPEYTLRQVWETVARKPAESSQTIDSEVAVIITKDRLADFAESSAVEFEKHSSHLYVYLTEHGFHYRLRMLHEEMNTIAGVARQIISTLRRILNSSPEDKVSELSIADSHDLEQIWKWNSCVFPASDITIYDLFAEIVQKYPDSAAVDAWDGVLSYKELDTASTAIASRLISLGLSPRSTVPLLFEKSKWMSVALLAVVKAGGACVALDSSLPDARLCSIIAQVHAALILTSEGNEARVSQWSICPGQVVNQAEIDSSQTKLVDQQFPLPLVHPDDPLCIMFTSGSTGVPKGALMSHRNLSTAVRDYAAMYHINRYSRVFDFVTYVFDVAWANVFLALCTGACLCAPSEDERKNDIEAAITKTRATFAFFTPSLARTIRHDFPHCLETVVCGGEKIVMGDDRMFGGKPRLVGVYGPAETSIFATFFDIKETESFAGYLGSGLLCNLWLTVPDIPQSLAAISAVGEIWIEGPIVGPGYFDDEARTAAAFINDPQWLLAGSPNGGGRRGRLYRTRDLARYRNDGSLEFVGRRDEQVKLRGQRLELGEIEYHTRSYLVAQGVSIELTVAAEVIVPREDTSQVIVAFIAPSHKATGTTQFRSSLLSAIAHIGDALAKVLPFYMNPSAFVLLDKMPRSATDKINRRALRELGSTLTIEQLDCRSQAVGNEERRQPQSVVEKQLQALWAKVLRKPPESIFAQDVFLRIGGDSITAMRLAASARRAGIKLKVADILKRPRLCDQAALIEDSESLGISKPSRDVSVPAFSLLKPGFEKFWLRKTAASLCQGQIAWEQVKDVFPCTPLQEGLLALSTKQPGDYVASLEFVLASTTHLNRLEDAWVRVVTHGETLRTRIVAVPGQGLTQVVLDLEAEHIRNEMHHSCDTKSFGLGTALCHAEIRRRSDATASKTSFILTIHHSLYDGWSLPRLIRAIEDAYEGRLNLETVPFQVFIKHKADILAERDSRKFWQEQLQDFEGSHYPTLPCSGYSPRANSSVDKYIAGTSWIGHAEFTPASFVKLSWAVLQAHYAGSSEAVFGTISSGRQIDLPGIDRISGPTIATLPIRISVDPTQPFRNLLRMVQQQALDMIPYEQIGLQNIRKINDEAEQFCRFQTMLLVEPADEKAPAKGILGYRVSKIVQREVFDAFNTYALLVSCRLDARGVTCKLSFDDHVIDQRQAERILAGLAHVLKTISDDPMKSVCKIDLTGPNDLQDIWAWNSRHFEAPGSCVHDLLAQTARIQPNALAIAAHDGALTYKELDTLSSLLARSMIALGIVPRSVVLLFFEKSMWMSVAAYAVMKIGGVSVALDVNQPEARLTATSSHASPKIVLASTQTCSLANSLFACAIWTLSHEGFEQLKYENLDITLPTVQFSDALLITYTSGSTGQPKGACLSHGNFVSAIHKHAAVYEVTSESTVFDFASYSFDMGWSNLLTTISSGACLYVPSDTERKDDLEGSLIRSQATFVMFTPSLARAVSSRILSRGLSHSLKVVAIGGEVIARQDHALFGPDTKIVSVYGPSECTVFVSWLQLRTDGFATGDLGSLYVTNAWIVRTEKPDSLAAIGAVGELYLEGPLVGIGYLNDEERTKAAFVNDAPWLRRGSNDQNDISPKGIVYRTGDLVRYKSDGGLQFIARRDQQVKIRGQRVELGEIESSIKKLSDDKNDRILQLAAEVIAPEGSERPSLVAFVVPTNAHNLGTAELKPTILRMMEGIETELSRILPSYMIPAAYIPLANLPLTSTGKIDRRQLRQIGASDTKLQLAGPTESGSRTIPILNPSDVRLSQMWAEVLNIPPGRISADANFFRLGGDSIAAMSLAALAHQQNLRLSVADIMQWPQLSKQATKILKMQTDSSGLVPISPFSLLRPVMDQNQIRREAAVLCKVSGDQIADIFPCTPLQEGLVALTSQRPGDYVAQMTFELPSAIDVSSVKDAWVGLVQSAQILRTRIIDLSGQGMVQVIVNEVDDSIKQSIGVQESNPIFGLGTALCHLGLSRPESSTKNTKNNDPILLVFTIHHALYDGWSLARIIRAFGEAYEGKIETSLLPMQYFVNCIKSVELKDASDFWQEQLKDAESPQFPALPQLNYRPRVDTIVKRHLTLPRKSLDFTIAAVIRASWAILQARYTGAADSVFGSVVTGRQITLDGIDQIAGPTIATVPVRILLESARGYTVRELLQKVQAQAIEMIKYEQTGLQYIRRISPQTKHSSRFQTLLIVHPGEEEDLVLRLKGKNAPVKSETVHGSLDAFGTYVLLINCRIIGSGLLLSLSFDSNVISQIQAERIAAQFEQVLQQVVIAQDGNHQICDIDAVSKRDMQEIWKWNAQSYEYPDESVHGMLARTAFQQPLAPAICAWDGDLSYADLDHLSTRLAYRLVEAGVSRGSIVPLCFEKSKWTSVAILGVMKAGGASVVLDITLPQTRICQIAQAVSSSVIVASTTKKALARSLNEGIVVTPAEPWGRLDECDAPSHENFLPQVRSLDRLYVVFTSGSTGTPKGAVVTHGNFCSALNNQTTSLGFHKNARVFDFVSHAFDIMWSNVLHTLFAGGCLCVPSEDDRRDDIAACMRELRVNFADITPTVARLLNSADLPELQTLLFCGEVVRLADVVRWKSVPTVINTYGPAEATANATMQRIDFDLTADPSIGRCLGGNTWITDPTDYTRLMPIGCIGELLIEGPLVGGDYLNNPEKTAAMFVTDPPWLSERDADSPGRRGRLYRTGDLARYTVSGALEFIGRADDQVKIRGQRIELGKIEYHVRRLLYRQFYQGEIEVVAEIVKPTEGDARSVLVVFITLLDLTATGNSLRTIVDQLVEGINSKLADVVPATMIPVAYFPFTSLPKTATGKTNRRLLRELGAIELNSQLNVLGSREAVMTPVGPMESVLLDVWAQVLNLPPDSISTTAYFSQLGGDSISAMQISSRCRSRGIKLKASSIIRFQTIQRIAPQSTSSQDISRQSRRASVREDRKDTQDAWLLAPIQQYFLDAHAEDHNHYNQSFILKMRRQETTAKMRNALTTIFDQHAQLRARFSRNGTGSWLQQVRAPNKVQFDFAVHTCADPLEIKGLAVRRQRALDIQNGPVFLADLFHNHPEGQVLLLTAHHLDVDLVSWRIIWRDLEEILNDRPVPKTGIDFRKWCELQADEAKRFSQRDALPFTPRSPNTHYWGVAAEQNLAIDAHTFTHWLDQKTTALLLGKSNQAFNTEIADLLVAMLNLAFMQTFTDRLPPDIYFEVHGREPIFGEDLDAYDTVGWFTSHHPLQFPNNPSCDAITMVRAAKELRRQIPGKGRPFFAWTCYNETGRQYAPHMGATEILLNYTGQFQQLEGSKSPFSALTTPPNLEQASPRTRRAALILVTIGVYEGKMELLFDIHNRMKRREALLKMAQTYSALLEEVAVSLINLVPAHDSVNGTDSSLIA